VNRLLLLPLLALATVDPVVVHAQASNPDAPFLASADPALAANKRLAYDFQRMVLDAGHLDLDYLQHNPNVPTGRDGFVAFFSRFMKPTHIAPRIKGHLVSVTAEEDLVLFAFQAELADPKTGHLTPTSWFDHYRVRNGQLVEHWDPSFEGMYDSTAFAKD
jgi:predicted SnoaL-like aldol condensation-catalyzing enzyme